jgi:uncharacterized protein with ParB-like and HNH nuclease domain
MSTITPHYRTVQQLLQSQSFSIDEYQREYKWERENIEELLGDLRDKFLSCYQEGDKTQQVSGYEDYFLGSIIVSKRNGKNYLVDGQQRVTSLTLLLIYLHNTAKQLGHDVVNNLAPLIYSAPFGNPLFNLDIVERLPVIEALFNNQPFSPDGKDESIQTMYNRYQDIVQIDLVGELKEALPHFIYWLINKVGLIEIATDNDSYAYAIFETMNDRGKPLSPVDMLKAYLLAPIIDDTQRRNANQVWKRQVLELISWGSEHEPERDAACIKAWFRAQYAETKREGKAGAADKDWELIGSAFHRWVRDNRARLGLGEEPANLAFITDHFTFFSAAYRQILEASRSYTAGLESIYYNAHNEFTWQNTVLLSPLCVTDDAATVKLKLGVTACYLDIWLMRRAVNYIRVGYSSTSYAMWSLCKEIRGLDLGKLVQLLTEKLAADDVTFAGSPSRNRYGISDLIITQFTRRYIYHLLARITAFTEVGAGKPDLFPHYVDRTLPNPCDIEHIWANKFQAYAGEFSSEEDFQRARNHVGGLLLLPADVNRSYQDKPFEEKAPLYAQQNFFAATLTEAAYKNQPKFDSFRKARQLPFKHYVTFGKAEQLERRKLVEELVNCVWSPERLQAYLPGTTV